MTSPAVLARKETPWIDAWIRWDRGTNTDDDDDDKPNQVAPTDTFSFHYTGSAEQPDIIDIELQGFPSDSEQTWNSTGLTLWRSSEHLCKYFVKEWQNGPAATGNLFANNRRFLEVGSGLGRGGILALHCLSLTKRPCDDDDDDGKEGNALLCLTDGDTDVLHHLRNNVKRNQPKEIQERTNVKLECSQLLWGRNHALEFLQHVDNQKFDVLFGSDLIYVTKVIQPLFETVSALLAESGCFIMAHCARREGNEVDVDMIFEAALSLGLKHEIVEEDEDISVFIFRRKA